jgi:hypothetical protein
VGVWVSTDNGDTWTRIANQENASFIVLSSVGTAAIALKVDPNDPAHILIGGVRMWDFSPGAGWQRINPANQDIYIVRLPSLIRDFVFLPNGEVLVIGDGRLVRITQNGTRIEDANRGIQATRILSVAVSPEGDVYASGASPVLITSNRPDDPAGLFRLVANVTTQFDGAPSPLGFVGVSAIDPEVAFFSYQDGRLRVTQDRGVTYVSFYTAPLPTSWDTTFIQPPGTGSGTPAWISGDRPERFGPLYPPFAVIEEFDELVLGTDNKRRGRSYLFIATGHAVWTITNPISTSPDSIPRWNRVSRRFLGVNASPTYSTYLSASNEVPTALAAVEAADTVDVWVGTSTGRLYRLRNAHDPQIDRSQRDSLEDLTASIATLADGRWISAIAVHPRNPNLLAVAVGSYAGPIDRIFLSTNATAATPTFTSIHANLPNIPVYSLFFYPDSAYFLLAGTEWGLWRCPDVNTPAWEEMTGEAVGRVPVTSITWKPYRYQVDTVGGDPDNPVVEGRILPDPEKPIYIGTWGRGVWKLNSRSATSLTGPTQATSVAVRVYPNPFSHRLQIQVSLPAGASQLAWRLYGIDGRQVGAHTHMHPLPAGEHTLSWVPPALPSGIYFLQVEVTEPSGRKHTQTLKLLQE